MAKKIKTEDEEKDNRSRGAKISEIFNGWKNVVFPNEHIEKIAKARAAICATCEYNVKSRCKKCCFRTTIQNSR